MLSKLTMQLDGFGFFLGNASKKKETRHSYTCCWAVTKSMHVGHSYTSANESRPHAKHEPSVDVLNFTRWFFILCVFDRDTSSLLQNEEKTYTNIWWLPGWWCMCSTPRTQAVWPVGAGIAKQLVIIQPASLTIRLLPGMQSPSAVIEARQGKLY